jgi:DNA-binding beta-propeller fold protein YncE
MALNVRGIATPKEITRMLRSAIVAAGLAALAFHPSLRADIMAYAVDINDNLDSVDLSTATATLIGSTGEFLEGIAISPGGTLYATDNSGNLYTLNSATGAATLVGSTGIGDVEGLAFDGSTLLGSSFSNPTTIYSIIQPTQLRLA